jgi:hypothetical protein
MNIGVIGYSGDVDNEPVKGIKEICINLGKELAKNGWTIFNGGRDGIMDLVSEGAKEFQGKVIGILPYEENGNEFLDYHIKTGLDFSMRSYVLVKSVDVVISVGGEIGTAIEILGAYANYKPVILFRNTGGWTDRIAEVLIEDKYLDNRKMACVYSVYSIDEMISLLKKIGDDKNELFSSKK